MTSSRDTHTQQHRKHSMAAIRSIPKHLIPKLKLKHLRTFTSNVPAKEHLKSLCKNELQSFTCEKPHRSHIPYQFTTNELSNTTRNICTKRRTPEMDSKRKYCMFDDSSYFNGWLRTAAFLDDVNVDSTVPSSLKSKKIISVLELLSDEYEYNVSDEMYLNQWILENDNCSIGDMGNFLGKHRKLSTRISDVVNDESKPNVSTTNGPSLVHVPKYKQFVNGNKLCVNTYNKTDTRNTVIFQQNRFYSTTNINKYWRNSKADDIQEEFVEKQFLPEDEELNPNEYFCYVPMNKGMYKIERNEFPVKEKQHALVDHGSSSVKRNREDHAVLDTRTVDTTRRQYSYYDMHILSQYIRSDIIINTLVADTLYELLREKTRRGKLTLLNRLKDNATNVAFLVKKQLRIINCLKEMSNSPLIIDMKKTTRNVSTISRINHADIVNHIRNRISAKEMGLFCCSCVDDDETRSSFYDPLEVNHRNKIEDAEIIKNIKSFKHAWPEKLSKKIHEFVESFCKDYDYNNLFDDLNENDYRQAGYVYANEIKNWNIDGVRLYNDDRISDKYENDGDEDEAFDTVAEGNVCDKLVKLKTLSNIFSVPPNEQSNAVFLCLIRANASKINRSSDSSSNG